MNFNSITFNFNNTIFNASPIHLYKIVYKAEEIPYRYVLVVIYRLIYTDADGTITSSDIPYYVSDGASNKYRAGLLLPFICINENKKDIPLYCPTSDNGKFGAYGTLYKYNIASNLDFNIFNKWILENLETRKSEPEYKQIFTKAQQRWKIEQEKGVGITSVLERIVNLLDFLIAIGTSRVDSIDDIRTFRPVSYPDQYNYGKYSDDTHILHPSHKLSIIPPENTNTIDDYYRQNLNIVLKDFLIFFKLYKIITISPTQLDEKIITIQEFNRINPICSSDTINPVQITNSANYSKISNAVYSNMKEYINNTRQMSEPDFISLFPHDNFIVFKNFHTNLSNIIKPTFGARSNVDNTLQTNIDGLGASCLPEINESSAKRVRTYKKYLKYKNKYTLLKESIFKGYLIERDSNESLTSNKNKFLNLRKQIEEFNIINEDNPINKNKHIIGGTSKKQSSFNLAEEHSSSGTSNDQEIALPESFNIVLKLLKYGNPNIPFISNIDSLIIAILNTSKNINNIMEIISDNDNLKVFTSINFKNGPIGVKEQYNTIMIKLKENKSYQDIIVSLCSMLKEHSSSGTSSILLENLKRFICNWVATIPDVGPKIASSIKNMKNISFNNFKDIYDKFPEENKKLFQNPDILRDIIDKFEKYIKVDLTASIEKNIRDELGVSKNGGGFADSILEKAKSTGSDLIKKGSKIIKTGVDATPLGMAIRLTGLDKIVVNASLDGIKKSIIFSLLYINKEIVPGVIVSIKALKLIFPLFFTLLLLQDECV